MKEIIYQVNAPGFRPYYTDSYLDAQEIAYETQQTGRPVTVRRMDATKALYKALHKPV